MYNRIVPGARPEGLPLPRPPSGPAKIRGKRGSWRDKGALYNAITKSQTCQAILLDFFYLSPFLPCPAQKSRKTGPLPLFFPFPPFPLRPCRRFRSTRVCPFKKESPPPSIRVCLILAPALPFTFLPLIFPLDLSPLKAVAAFAARKTGARKHSVKDNSTSCPCGR